METFTVIIGVATVQDSTGATQPVNGEPQSQLQVEVQAVDATAAFDHVQARLQELLSAPVGS